MRISNLLQSFTHGFNTRPAKLFPIVKFLDLLAFVKEILIIGFDLLGDVTLVFNAFLFVSFPKVFD
jgi:hypothetical protein